MLTNAPATAGLTGAGASGTDGNTAPPTHTGGPSLGGPGETLSADFFRKLIGDNTATITAKLDKVTGDLASLSRTVEASKAEIATVHSEVQQHSRELVEQKNQIVSLADRIARLEGGRANASKANLLSPAYLLARRSVRMVAH